MLFSLGSNGLLQFKRSLGEGFRKGMGGVFWTDLKCIAFKVCVGLGGGGSVETYFN